MNVRVGVYTKGSLRHSFRMGSLEDARRQLTGKELEQLAKQLVETRDEAEVARIRIELTEGFYGESMEQIRERETKAQKGKG